MPATTTQRLYFLAILALILGQSTNHAFVTIRATSYSPNTPQIGSRDVEDADYIRIQRDDHDGGRPSRRVANTVFSRREK
jgi:hypothetical protein